MGTYTLVGGVREGSLAFLDERLQAAGAPLRCAGVFDARWGDGDRVVLACADGCAVVCDPGGERARVAAALQPRDGADAAPPSPPMLTSCDWLSPTLVAAVSQDGWAHLLDLGGGGCRSWLAHALEPWCCRRDPCRPFLVYTGGDDGQLCGWDTRCGGKEVLAVARGHGAGVTAAEPCPHRDCVLATGSYDERVRTWDVRCLGSPVRCAEVCLGGGAWRLAWHPHQPATLLVAAMHAGFAVLRGDQLAVAQRHGHDAQPGQHGSLGYAVAWLTTAAGHADALTASYYDRSLQLWTPEPASVLEPNEPNVE